MNAQIDVGHIIRATNYVHRVFFDGSLYHFLNAAMMWNIVSTIGKG
jgi:hypothetical protein